MAEEAHVAGQVMAKLVAARLHYINATDGNGEDKSLFVMCCTVVEAFGYWFDYYEALDDTDAGSIEEFMDDDEHMSEFSGVVERLPLNPPIGAISWVDVEKVVSLEQAYHQWRVAKKKELAGQ